MNRESTLEEMRSTKVVRVADVVVDKVAEVVAETEEIVAIAEDAVVGRIRMSQSLRTRTIIARHDS
jgi:predicted secreted protein